MDKTPIIIIVIIVLAAALFFVFSNPKNPNIEPTPMPEGIVFFYGDTCPHCKNVEDFVAQNNIQEKVKFTSLEVYRIPENAQLLINTGISCKIDKENIGSVPLLWDPSTISGQVGKCYLGDVDIIDYFKNAAGIK